MKALLILIIFLFSSISFAGNWVAKSEVKNYLTVYAKKVFCESAKGEKCFNITGKDRRKIQVGFMMPVVAESSECADGSDCQSKIDDSSFACSEGVPSFDDKANWPTLDFVAEERPATGWFLWCQKEGLVIDSAGSTAADAEDAAKATEKSTRSTKKGERDTELKQCVRVALKAADLNAGSATTNQLANRQNRIKDCLGVFMKEVLEQRLELNDL